MTVFTRASNHQSVSLGKQIASSGEGEVWETNLSDCLAKIYHNPTPERIKKLEVMLANPPADPMASQNHISIAWPKDLLKDRNGAYVGFLMPAIRESRQLSSVYNPRRRKQIAPSFNWYYLHVTALNAAWIIQAIHAKGYVLGDIKLENILVNERALVAAIDTDSFQVRDSRTGKVYRCTVGSESFTPVELLGKDFSTTDQTEIHDRFRLAVLIHYLLFGYHPFSGQWVGSGESPEQTELICKGFWYGGQNSLIRPSQNTIPLDVVHPEIKRCFLQCFNEGHTAPDVRPTAEDWHNALQVAIGELTVCGKVDSHHYSRHYGKCYWCERAAKLGVDIFSAVPGTSSTAVKTTTTPSTATQTIPSSAPASQTSKQSALQPLANSPPAIPATRQSSPPLPVSSTKHKGKFKNIPLVVGLSSTTIFFALLVGLWWQSPAQVLNRAEKLAAQGQLKEAIETLKGISKGSDKFDVVQQKMWEYAFELYEKFGQLDVAISSLKAVSTDTSVEQKTQQTIQQWNEEWRRNENYYNAAQQAVNEERWWDAAEQANEITTPYWQEKVRLIAQESNQKTKLYTKLRELLAVGEWKQADIETLKVMLKVAGIENQRSAITTSAVYNFPCSDLRTIDRLWAEYSDGRFGFSVQKTIFETRRRNRSDRLAQSNLSYENIDYEEVHNLFYTLGWGSAAPTSRDYERYDDFYSTQNADYKKHLPALWASSFGLEIGLKIGNKMVYQGDRVINSDSSYFMRAMLARTESCGL